MKVQLVRPNEPSLGNYERIDYVDTLDLSSIEDNECEVIVGKSLLDRFPIEKAADVLSLVVSKMRSGGELVLSGLSLMTFGINAQRRYTETQWASSVFQDRMSVHNRDEVAAGLRELGLEVTTVNLHGDQYEITARRP